MQYCLELGLGHFRNDVCSIVWSWDWVMCAACKHTSGMMYAVLSGVGTGSCVLLVNTLQE